MFLLRLFYQDDEQLKDVDNYVVVLDLQQQFYQEWERGFNFDRNENPANLHFFWHMRHMRLGPAWEFSCEPYEALYFTLQKCYAAGTLNLPKQVLSNSIARDYVRHRCQGSVPLTLKTEAAAEKSRSVDDSLVFSYSYKVVAKVGDRSILKRETTFLRLLHVPPHGPVRGRVLKCEPFQTHSVGLGHLPWDMVGVFRFRGDMGDVVELPREAIAGKGMLVNRVILVEWPTKWLYTKSTI